MKPAPLVLERLWDPLWSARLRRQEFLQAAHTAKERVDTRALNLARREARDATTAVVRLELGR
jgi:hypothetical protein